MTLTPSSLRLDLKCGKGAISEGEKCTKGAATRVQEARPTLPGKSRIKKSYVALAAYGGLVAIGLYQAKNVRQAYAQKFDPAQRYTNYTGTIGNPADVIKQMQRSNKAGAPSLFGDVTFGKLNGKDIIVKRLGSKGPLGAMQVTAMEMQGVISAKTGDALRKAQGALQTNEVQGAELAGKLGFGPRVVAAGNNSLITEVARGRPLSSQDRLARNGAKLQQELQQNPGAGIKKIAKLQWLGFTKGTEISAINKNRIIDNMARMHTAGISHNDLHPGNIFVSDKGAQFIDFGTSERGGGAVSAEFVRMMNPPRTGLQQNGGMGYNLRSVDPKGYAVADKRIRQAIGKSVGTLTAADIHKAVTKSSNKELLEQQLQKITDDYYMEHARRPRSDSLTPASLRLRRDAAVFTDKELHATVKAEARRKTDMWATGFDAEDGKKYTKVVTNPETGRKNRIRYGAKGYKIAPGTDKGDRYCARSFGDMKSHGKDCAGADRNTPLCLSRTKWRCSGKASRRDGALTPGK
jgi:predicted Ser/Thr protein kinase